MRHLLRPLVGAAVFTAVWPLLWLFTIGPDACTPQPGNYSHSFMWSSFYNHWEMLGPYRVCAGMWQGLTLTLFFWAFLSCGLIWLVGFYLLGFVAEGVWVFGRRLFRPDSSAAGQREPQPTPLRGALNWVRDAADYRRHGVSKALPRYLEQARLEGHSDQDIGAVLSGAGWTKEEIVAALGHLPSGRAASPM